MRLAASFSATLLVASLLFACSSGSDDDDSPDATVSNIDATQNIDAVATPDADTTDADTTDADTTDADTTDADTTDADTTDADTTDADTTDADTTDAAFGCTASGDYVESDDVNNDLYSGAAGTGTPEATGISLGAGGSYTIGGCIDPAQTNSTAGVADTDFYGWTLAADSYVRIMLTAPSGAAATNLGVYVYDVTNDEWVGGAAWVDGGALVTRTFLAAGQYLLTVEDDVPGPGGIITYTATIANYAITCDNDVGAADYTEASDGTGHGNDMITIEWTTPGFGLTPAVDTPEATGLVVAAGSSYRVSGVSANITSAGDDYYDRDTFLFTTGATTNEVHIRLNWPDDDDDLDVFLFSDDGADLIDYSAYLGTDDDEEFAVRVEPGTSYWLWVGTYSDAGISLPVSYDVTICASAITWAP